MEHCLSKKEIESFLHIRTNERQVQYSYTCLFMITIIMFYYFNTHAFYETRTNCFFFNYTCICIDLLIQLTSCFCHHDRDVNRNFHSEKAWIICVLTSPWCCSFLFRNVRRIVSDLPKRALVVLIKLQKVFVCEKEWEWNRGEWIERPARKPQGRICKRTVAMCSADWTTNTQPPNISFFLQMQVFIFLFICMILEYFLSAFLLLIIELLI